MLLQLVILLACLIIGLLLQRSGHGEPIRAQVWRWNYILLIPVAGLYAVLSTSFDAQRLGLLACGVVAWWLVVLIGWVWARVALPASEPGARTATWMSSVFPNTGFIGFPLAELIGGRDGLRLAILYDQVSLVIPAVVVSTLMARHGARAAHLIESGEEAQLPPWSPVRELLLSPPLWAIAVGALLRVVVVHDPIELDLVGTVIAAIVGPLGFLLLGVSLPLGGGALEARHTGAAMGAVVIRIAAAPALLWLCCRLAGVDAPLVSYWIAAMPTAFHPLIIGRINGLEVRIIRRTIIVSTALVLAATGVWALIG